MNLVTVVLSVFALGVSVSALVVSTRLKQFELRRSIRNQLNVVVAEMLASAAREVSFLPPGEAPTPEQIARSSIAAQRHSALARQAYYLAEEESSLVTDVEWVTMAQGFWTAGDLLKAESCWSRGIDAAPDPYYRVVNSRGLADFLFMVGRQEEGRERYQEALRVFPDTTDSNKTINAGTLEAWVLSEIGASQDAEAERLIRKARGLISTIGNSVQRSQAEARLRAQVDGAREWQRRARGV